MSKITCQKCKKSFETKDKEMGIETFHCPACGFDNRTKIPPVKKESAPKAEAIAVQSEEKGEGKKTSATKKKKSVWESKWKTNLVNAYIETVKMVITQPVNYFKTVKPFEDFFSLAVFIYINSFITILASMAFQVTFGAVFNPAALMGIPFLLCAAIVAPFLTTAIAFLIGLILHLFLNFIGGSEKNYNTTMTVYGLGSAANLFGIIPFVGGLIALVYTIIINIFGQAEAHEITVGRAALSVILPFFIFICLIATIIFAIAMLAGGLGVFLEGLQ